MRIVGLDWDNGNTDKCQKHGVSTSEIEQVFKNVPAVFPDVEHSQDEDRYIAIGTNAKDKYIFLIFTYRSKNKGKYIRPISARYMRKKEVNKYKEYE